jgi:hypothetical protein
MNSLSLYSNNDTARAGERGNILFIILLAVVLTGLLTAAIQSTNRPEGSNIDRETLAIRVSEVQRYASELERAVNYIMQDGKSEVDIRFAHYDAHADYGDITVADGTYGFSNQVFHADGGAANYKAAPAGVNDGSAWEFYGGTHIPGMGTPSRAELVAVLPNVTQAFCDKVNELNGQSTPLDTGASSASGLTNAGDCVNIGALGRFDASKQYYNIVNTMDETSFTQDDNTSAARPAPQACVRCSVGPANHFYHVLLSR